MTIWILQICSKFLQRRGFVQKTDSSQIKKCRVKTNPTEPQKSNKKMQLLCQCPAGNFAQG